MKKLLTTAIIAVAILPQATNAMVIDGTFPFLHPLKASTNRNVSVDVNSSAPHANRTLANVNQREHKNRNASSTVNIDTDKETNTSADAFITQLSGRLNTVVNNQLENAQNLRAKIATNGTINAETAARITADIDADEAFFTEQQTAIGTATTVADLRTIGQAIKNYISERKQRLQERRTELHTQVQASAGKAQEIGETMVSKLQKISTALQGHDIDTTNLDAQISALSIDVAALADVDTSNGPGALREEIKNIREEIRSIVSTIKSLVKKG